VPGHRNAWNASIKFCEVSQKLGIMRLWGCYWASPHIFWVLLVLLLLLQLLLVRRMEDGCGRCMQAYHAPSTGVCSCQGSYLTHASLIQKLAPPLMCICMSMPTVATGQECWQASAFERPLSGFRSSQGRTLSAFQCATRP
jgi:hypothetical protein